MVSLLHCFILCYGAWILYIIWYNGSIKVIFLHTGQFWNVPVTVEEHTGFFNGQDREDDYNITVHYPGTEARSFVGLKLELTWEFEERVCYYVGNRQGGVLAEVTGGPVIEGEYTDYKVTSIFATSFTYSHFDEDQCSVIA